MYHAGTRFLSRLRTAAGGRQPLLLSSTISDDNVVFSADLTNPDVIRDGRASCSPRGTLHLFRARVLRDDIACRAAPGDQSRPRTPVEVPLTIQLEADFADIFEVRGTRRLHAATRWRR